MMYREIRNKALRLLLDKKGLSDVHLIKGEGYFYVTASGEHQSMLEHKRSTSIYLNSFGQQSVRQWVDDIDAIIRND